MSKGRPSLGDSSNPQNVRFSLDSLNNTLREQTSALSHGLVSATSLKLKPFAGLSDPTEWLSDFLMMANAADWDEDFRVKRFPMYLIGGAANWFRYKFDGVPNITWNNIVREFKSHFAPEEADAFLERKIISGKQQYNEPVTNYYDRIRDICNRRNPPLDAKQTLKKLMEGLDPRIKKFITFFNITNLDKFLLQARRIEITLENNAELETIAVSNILGQPNNNRIDGDNMGCMQFIQNRLDNIEKKISMGKNWNKTQNTNRNPGFRRPTCYNCNKVGHIANECKKRRNSKPQGSRNNYQRNSVPECGYCTKKGHKENECRIKILAMKKKQGQNSNSCSNVTVDNLSEEELLHTLNVLYKKKNMTPGALIATTVLLNGKPFTCIIDTGSQITLINHQTFESLNIPLEPYTGPRIESASLSMLTPRGQCDLEVKYRENGMESTAHVKAIVVERLPGNSPALIGQDVNSIAGVQIDCQARTIKIKKKTSIVNAVHIKDEIVLPSRVVTKVDITAANKQKLKDGEYLVSTSNDIYTKTKAIIPNSVTTFQHGLATVELSNLNPYPIKLNAGSTIGTYEPISPNEVITCAPVSINTSDTNIEVKENEYGMNAIQTYTKNDAVARKCEIDGKEIKIGNQLTDEQFEKLHELLLFYRPVFAFTPKALGVTDKFKHTIDTGNSPPIHSAPYRLPPYKREIANKLIQEMCDFNIIQPSNSPWASPIVLVGKKTGDLRFCVDYRKVNRATKRDQYPLPNIQDSLDALEGAKYFTSLDMKSGYYQIEMNPNDRQKTAFITQDGLYEFKVMPFGLTNAPATFQRCMDVILSGLKYNSVLVYLDDILIFSNTFEQHLRRIETVFIRLLDANLRLNPSKCSFCLPEITYLGIKVTAEGQYPDEEKIKAVASFETPKNVRDIRSFVSLCSYYRKFVHKFAEKAKPLTTLIKKDVDFCWSEEQEKAFNILKQSITNPPVLTHFNGDLPIELRTDASDVGIGAILVQKHQTGWKPVCYASRQLLPREQNYTTSEKECLAIIFAVEKFRQYLENRYFVIKTDHCSLCFLQSKQKLPPRLIRWSLMLQEFNFDVQYKSGTHNKDADCLSRYPITSDSNSEPDLEDDDKIFACTIISNGNIRTEQQKDKRITTLAQKLKILPTLNSKERKKLKNFAFSNGGLVCRIIYQGKEKLLKPYLPTSLREIACQNNHDDLTSGHVGFSKTLYKISERYYWPGMYKFIKKYVASCPECQVLKTKPTERIGYLQPILTPGPFHKIGIDIIGPLPRAGNKIYIIVCIDLFTKWIETRALSSSTASKTAKFIAEQVLCRHGAPAIMISDQGTNFISSTIKQLNKFMSTLSNTTTAYHPQTNGQTERVNAVIKKMIAMYVNEFHSNWDELLPFVTLAYNTAKQDSIGMSPFELVYGRKPTLPQDVNMLQIDDSVENIDKYVRKMKHEWPKIRELAEAAMKQSQAKMKSQYDESAKHVEYSIGQLVLLRDTTTAPGLSRKLTAKWIGPYRVIGRISELVYDIKPAYYRGKTERVNVQRLKEYVERTPYYESDSDEEELPPRSRLAHQTTPLCTPTKRDRESSEEWRKTPLPKDKDDSFTSDTTEESFSTPRSTASDSEPLASEGFSARYPVRSTRSKLSKLSLLTLLTMLTVVSGQFASSPPIIWRKARTQPISTSTQVNYKLFYVTPCENLIKLPQRYYLKLEEWCKTQMTTDFFDPLYSICPIKGTDEIQTVIRKHHIGKRGLPVMAVGIFVVAVAQIFTSAFQLYHGRQNFKMRKEIEQLQEYQEKVNKATELLTDDLYNITRRFKDLHSRVEENERMIIPLITRTSLLATQLSIVKKTLIRTVNTKNKGFLDRDFIETFNLTLPCMKDCVIDRIEFHDCHTDPREESINLKLDVPIESKDSILIEADAFKLMTISDSKICRSSYTGPELLLLNTYSDKVCVLPSSYKVPDRLPSGEECNDIQDHYSIKELWNKHECFDRTEVSPKDFVQVKRNKNGNRIYCSGSNFTLNNKTLPCPKYPFQVPADITFKINHLIYRSRSMSMSSRYDLTPSTSVNVNFQMLGDLEPHVEYHEEEVRNYLKGMETSHRVTVLHVIFPTSLMMIILMALTTVIIYYKIWKKRSKKIQLEPLKEEIKMEKLGHSRISLQSI